MGYCPDCEFEWNHSEGNGLLCPVCNEEWRPKIRPRSPGSSNDSTNEGGNDG